MREKVVVLGGTSGIGLATSLSLKESYDVHATGRDSEKIAKLAQEHGKALTFHAVNSCDGKALAGFMAGLKSLDHLVLCLSGAQGGGLLKDLTLEDLRAGFDAKFWPHLQSVKAALPYLSQRGSITFVTSVSGRLAAPGIAGLAAINGAIEAMVRPLAVELAPIRVNAVAPGVTDTAWWSFLPEAERQAAFAQYATATTAGRVGKPEEIAEVIALLLRNSYLTGQTIVCDGGLHLKAA